MADIDIDDFASQSLHGRLSASGSTHTIAAVGMLRSKLKDDVANGQFGPFQFTQPEWDANPDRTNPALGAPFASNMIADWRAQTTVFALMAQRDFAALQAALPQPPAPSSSIESNGRRRPIRRFPPIFRRPAMRPRPRSSAPSMISCRIPPWRRNPSPMQARRWRRRRRAARNHRSRRALKSSQHAVVREHRRESAMSVVPAWLATLREINGTEWAPGDGPSDAIVSWLHYVGSAFSEHGGLLHVRRARGLFLVVRADRGIFLHGRRPASSRYSARPTRHAISVGRSLARLGHAGDPTAAPVTSTVFDFGGGDHHVTLFESDNGNGTWGMPCRQRDSPGPAHEFPEALHHGNPATGRRRVVGRGSQRRDDPCRAVAVSPKPNSARRHQRSEVSHG